jgi:hypothetical protein
MRDGASLRARRRAAMAPEVIKAIEAELARK